MIGWSFTVVVQDGVRLYHTILSDPVHGILAQFTLDEKNFLAFMADGLGHLRKIVTGETTIPL